LPDLSAVAKDDFKIQDAFLYFCGFAPLREYFLSQAAKAQT
jgi:hypothetical protein